MTSSFEDRRSLALTELRMRKKLRSGALTDEDYAEIAKNHATSGADTEKLVSALKRVEPPIPGAN